MAGNTTGTVLARRFDYRGETEDARRKEIKEHTLTNNPNELFCDTCETNEISNLIFYSDFIEQWKNAIEAAYPGTTRRTLTNGLQLQLPDNGVVNVYLNRNLPGAKFVIQLRQVAYKEFAETFHKIKDGDIFVQQLMNIGSDSDSDSD